MIKLNRIVVYILIVSIISASLCSCSNEQIIYEHRLQWWLSDINWDNNRNELTGKNIKVAVIDSGVTINDEIRHAIIKEDKSIASSSKLNAHGTAITNIISAIPINKKSVLGIATNAKIISIDITDDTSGKVTIENLIKGIEIAIKNDVDIINISVGVLNGNDALRTIINKAYDTGIILIAAAGNFMDNRMLFPAAYENVVAVGSKSKDDEIISPSGIIKESTIYLPGENIVTALGENTYESIYGTSASCAIMSGIAALVLEKAKGDIPPDEFIKRISKLYGRTDLTVNDFLI